MKSAVCQVISVLIVLSPSVLKLLFLLHPPTKI
jgi:hypothetical protein